MADKLELFAKKHIDGHAPGIRGKEVQAYRLAGVENDHECSTAEEVLDKLRAGLHIYVREGSGAKNLETLIKTMLDAGVCLDRCAFCTDDKHVEEIRKANDMGVICGVTTNPSLIAKEGKDYVETYQYLHPQGDCTWRAGCKSL